MKFQPLLGNIVRTDDGGITKAVTAVTDHGKFANAQIAALRLGLVWSESYGN